MCWVPPNAVSLRKFQVVAFDTRDTEPVSRGGLQHSSGVPWEKALGSKKLKSTHNNLDQGGLCGQTQRHSEPKAGRSRASEGPEPGSISLPSVLTPACFSFSHTLAPPLTCSVHQHTWHMHAHTQRSTFPPSQFSRPRDKNPRTGYDGLPRSGDPSCSWLLWPWWEGDCVTPKCLEQV